MGMFYRTIRMVDNGIKPMYVFDGKPPQLKSGEVSILKMADSIYSAVYARDECC